MSRCLSSLLIAVLALPACVSQQPSICEDYFADEEPPTFCIQNAEPGTQSFAMIIENDPREFQDIMENGTEDWGFQGFELAGPTGGEEQDHVAYWLYNVTIWGCVDIEDDNADLWIGVGAIVVEAVFLDEAWRCVGANAE